MTLYTASGLTIGLLLAALLAVAAYVLVRDEKDGGDV